jgi:hypothetical protein
MDIYKCPISEIGGRDLNFLYIIHFWGWGIGDGGLGILWFKKRKILTLLTC